jgi:hypothetical protein
MDPQLIALAASAAQTLVTAMTTDGWAMVRERFARLVGRGDDAAAARAAQSLETARADTTVSGPDTVAGRWQGRLEMLIEEHPEVAAELAALLTELGEARDGSDRVRIVSGRDTFYAGRDQIIRQAPD